MSWLELGKGSARSKMPSSRLKIVVELPIPRAQRDDHNGGEQRRPQKRADRIANIAKRMFQPAKSPLVAGHFGHQSHISEFAQCDLPCGLWRFAILDMAGCLHSNVGREFIVQFAFEITPLEKSAEK